MQAFASCSLPFQTSLEASIKSSMESRRHLEDGRSIPESLSGQETSSKKGDVVLDGVRPDEKQDRIPATNEGIFVVVQITTTETVISHIISPP